VDVEIGGSSFQFGDSGTLVYQPSNPEGPSVLVWVDRDGDQELLAAPPAGWTYVDISPDGKRVAVERITGKERDIYIWDLERAILSRLTDDPFEDSIPRWSADGNRIFFSSNRTGVFNVYSRAADGSGSDELVAESDVTQYMQGLTPDGSQVVVAHQGEDLVAIDLGPPHQAHTLLATKFAERTPSFSPDGRWVAYESDADGQPEVYVRPFPDLETRLSKISSGGGEHPLWSAKGDEIFFRDPSGSMMAAQVALTPTFAPGKVTELFSNPPRGEYFGGGSRGYAVSPLNDRFLMTLRPTRRQSDRLIVVMNWFEELKAKVPVP
jgi:Tol biopolymer transport system component